MIPRLRFWTVVVLLAATALLLAHRRGSEPTPLREPLSRIPDRMAGWEGRDQSIDPQILEVLGAGEFVSRIYTSDSHASPVSLFVAYFPTQRTGATIHSPKNCLPGAGWIFESSEYVDLRDEKGGSHRVGEYVLANGGNRQFVIYWYEAHGRSVASEYSAKFYLVADAIRMNRSDGALVRVITPIGSSEEPKRAKMRVESFVAQLAPMLPRFIPD